MAPIGVDRTTRRWSIASSAATVAASTVALFAILFGYQQFRQTHELEREAKAVELFVKYNELMKEARAGSTPGENPEARFWRDNLSVGIAESIFRFRRDEEGWVETVKWMVSHHKEFLLKEGLNCDTFDDEFEELVNAVVGENVCRPQ